MNKKLLSWLITFCALGLASIAGYYSIIGLSKLFAGVGVAVIIMVSFLEFSKIVLATLLHSYWKELNKIFKSYFIISLIVLSVLTSIGIYGILVSGYTITRNQMNLNNSQIELLEGRKINYQEQLNVYKDEKTSTNNSIIELRKGLSDNKIQYVDKETGQLVNTTSSNTRKALLKQLDQVINRQNTINNKIDTLNLYVFNTDNEILTTKNKIEAKNELGPLIYLSDITGKPMNVVVNYLLLIIIFVFDPLAISLVIAANFSFSQLNNNKKKTMKTIETPKKKVENIKTTVETPKKVVEKFEEEIDPLYEEKQILANPNISTFRKNKIRKAHPELM